MKKPKKTRGLSIVERISNWTAIDVETNCWIWLGATNNKGYGVMTINHKVVYAHRAAFIEFHGSIPNGMFVCHRCDHPACCNPLHLFLGTQADNLADMTRKGRSCPGERNGMAKLTRELVEQIRCRADEGPETYLASVFGVSRSQIGRILRGERWAK